MDIPEFKLTDQDIKLALFPDSKFPSTWNVKVLNAEKTGTYFLISNADSISVAVGVFNRGDADVSEFEEVSKLHPSISLFYSVSEITRSFKAFRKSFDTTNFSPLKEQSLQLLEVKKSERDQKLTPLGNGLENVFFEAHSHLRDIDGLHADSALDEICKVLIAKLYDEQQSKKLFSSMYTCIDESSAVVRSIFSKAMNEQNNSKASTTVSRPLILSAPALAKVVKEFERFDFTNSPIDIKGRAFQNLLSPALRSGMGQYFTPAQVVRMIVNCIDPKSTEKILDPFCGSAHFLTESVNHILKNESKYFDSKQYVKQSVFGIDKSERMIRIGSTDVLLMDGALPNLILSDSLIDTNAHEGLSKSSFDVVMTNPPFGSILGQEAFSSLGHFDLLAEKSSVPLEVLGLERSIQFLKENGRLAIVLPDSILLNKKSSYIRSWLSSSVKIRAIIGLPIEAFSPFGASVKTSILICTKSVTAGEYNVFMATVGNIGYDASGREKKGSEMDKVVTEFRSFIEREGW